AWISSAGAARSDSDGDALFVEQAVEQDRAQVALARVRQDGDDRLAGVLGALGEAHGDRGGGAARYAGENALLARQAARVLDRLLVADLLDRVDELEVEHIRHKARADALDLVRTGLQRLAGALLGEHGARGRLDRDRLDRLALGPLDEARDAGDGAAGADAGDEDVDRALGVVPDLRAGGLFVDRGVGG